MDERNPQKQLGTIGNNHEALFLFWDYSGISHLPTLAGFRNHPQYHRDKSQEQKTTAGKDRKSWLTQQLVSKKGSKTSYRFDELASKI